MKFEVKNNIIWVIMAVIFVVGGLGGAGIMYGIMKPEPVDPNTITSTGDTNTIQVKEVIVYKDRIKWKTISNGTGEIETTMLKDKLCPEIKRKHIISLNVRPFYQTNSVFMSYEADYQHIFLHRFTLNTGLNVNHDLLKNTVEGVGVKIGVGFMF